YLPHILRAISRAKDEYVDPAHYTGLAQAMLAHATTAEQQEAAGKALEVARVYHFYQQSLERAGLLDFGDLICRPIDLLRQNEDVRDELRRTYQHVLVDEYQDVNRASGLLLKEVAGPGSGLWTVGDVRQSIHRWRGAAPANMRLFQTDFPDAADPLTLKVNYRSQPQVVDTFAALVPHMRATEGERFVPWK